MSKHTKGPWRWTQRQFSALWDLVGPDGAANLVGVENIDPEEADARLIAAAAELLEAVKRIHDRQNCVCKLNPYVGGPVPCETCVLSALIARATGRES